MRLKKVKGAKEIIENCTSVVLEPNKNKGKWNKVFNNDNPICIEVGMGKGKFIIENAKTRPDFNFIGIEMFDSVIVRATQKLEEELPNLRLIRMDAKNIEEVFNHEIDTIYLNFSDPWPKNRNEKRRLTSEQFLNRYNSLFKNEKRIIQKTDNRKLFEFSLISLTNYGYKLEEVCLDLYQENVKGNISTEYEERFINKGLPIYKLVVIKND